MTTRQPLVLLPGMGCSGRLWDPVLASAHLRNHQPLDVLRPGLVGSSMDECVDKLLAELPDRFVLGGLSLGAIVSLALIRKAPERVTGLALLAINPRAPRPDQRAAWKSFREELANGRSARSVQEELLPLLFGPAPDPDLCELALAMAEEIGAPAYDGQLGIQESRIDETRYLSRIEVPTLVVAGAEDRMVPVDRHRETSDAIPGARLLVLPDVAHLISLEAPDLVAAEIAGSLLAGS